VQASSSAFLPGRHCWYRRRLRPEQFRYPHRSGRQGGPRLTVWFTDAVDAIVDVTARVCRPLRFRANVAAEPQRRPSERRRPSPTARCRETMSRRSFGRAAKPVAMPFPSASGLMRSLRLSATCSPKSTRVLKIAPFLTRTAICQRGSILSARVSPRTAAVRRPSAKLDRSALLCQKLRPHTFSPRASPAIAETSTSSSGGYGLGYSTVRVSGVVPAML
jgi:hypothetical protein